MSLQVVNQRRSDFQVYLYPAAEKVGLFAKKELLKYVEKMSGVKLPDAQQPGLHTITLGLREELYGGVPPCAEGFDGFTIVTNESGIVICGENARGLLYGVYDLLEQWGCRFYLPQLDSKDTEVVPEKAELAVEFGVRSVASPMELRIINMDSFISYFEQDATIETIDWAAKNRYNGISWQPPHHQDTLFTEIEKLDEWSGVAMMEERDLLLHGPGHSFYHFLQPHKHFADHPEYFGMDRNGNRTDNLLINFCWSNEDAVKITHDNIIAFAKKWPILQIVYLVATDGGAVCHCPKCQDIGGSNLLIDFFNKLADRMEAELPGVYLEGVVGYGPMEDIPVEIKPNGKWGGLHAHWGRDHTRSYDDTDYSNYAELYVWNKLFPGKLQICHYYTDNCHQPYIGPPYLYALEADMDYMVKHRIKGSFVLNHPMGTWWNMGFNNFMGGRIAYYYPELKPEDALRDFCDHYFGEKASETMFTMKKVMSDNLRRVGPFNTGNANMFDKKWMGYLHKMSELAHLESAGEAPYAYRIEKQIKAFEHQMKWAEREESMHRCEDALRQAREGDMTKEEAQAIIESEKQKMEDLKAFGYELEQSHPGTVDGTFFENWNLNRLFFEPVKQLEARLAKLG